MLNQIVLMGRLTKDPELRSTQSGTNVASFTIACERDSGEKDKKEVDFIDCVAWRHTGEFISRYFRKGSMIALTGRLQSRKWEDRDGNKRVNWEILTDHAWFCGDKNGGDAEPDTATDGKAGFEELSEEDGDPPF